MSNPETSRPTQWLSRGVEQLFETMRVQKKKYQDAHEGQQNNRDEELELQHRDIIVVGTGYGGAVAAATLTATRRADGSVMDVVVLERGKEFLPGAFPSDASSLPGHVRWSTPGAAAPGGNREGLFDVRIGPDVSALLANGLGGGSLINAGVMLEPDAAALTRLGLWSKDLVACYSEVRTMLGTPAGNTISLLDGYGPGTGPRKFHALKALKDRMDKAQFEAVPISVAMQGHTNAAGVALDACIQCGDCATGCNHNAKLSLDANVLVKARQQGAEIYTDATVLKIERTKFGWCLHVVYTDAQLRRRHPSPFMLYARRVILAAGTFGSTEILLRSRSDDLVLPKRLGQGFSSNGDMIAVAYDYQPEVNGVADERVAPAERKVGPTITARIKTTGQRGSPLCFQEMAVPAALRRIFEEMTTTSAVLHHMGRIDWSEHTADGVDPCAVSAAAIRRSSILAAMGDDGATGELELVGEDAEQPGDGAVRVRWPGLRDHPIFEEQLAAIPVAGDETVLQNPSWRLLSKQMEEMIVAKRGPLTTVHPLGGCSIGPSADYVVDQHGKVRLPQYPQHDGTLLVLDGAIVPGALGVNPALTIAALSLRASKIWCAKWIAQPGRGAQAPVPLAPSPRRAATILPVAPVRTEVEVVERLGGAVRLAGRDYMLELTIRYRPRDVAQLALPQGPDGVPLRRTQKVDGRRSKMELYDLALWKEWLKLREGLSGCRPEPLAKTRLFGTLDFMHREPSGPWRRILRGALAWARNRGGRDTVQRYRLAKSTRSPWRNRSDKSTWIAIKRWAIDLLALASRAGEVRRFDYQLRIGKVLKNDTGIDLQHDMPIEGAKRLTYACLSNPVTQLSTLALSTFPSLQRSAKLLLDTDFLVEENAPLLKIMGQKDQPAALLDLLGMGASLARVLINIHLWTFRKPDAPRARTAQLLPGVLHGLPDPAVFDVPVDRLPDGTEVYARLTRYKRGDTRERPVVLIHGYSTSGTSFAHPKVDPNLASHLWQQGRDVWVLDLRTSSGMPFARHPWSFEQVALADIPAAIDLVCRTTRRKKVDIMAHCMGAAMMGMAVLAELKPGERFCRERALLPKRIRRMVLSQVGPLVVFTQANVLRAYLMSYVRNLFPGMNYSFRVEGEPTLRDELLDRLLSAMPYPRAELAIENPWWPWANTEFVGTRHRMDALYGRDFNLLNVDRNVLDNLDDFFGPLNLETVSQSIHLARRKTIANRAGRNVYVSRERLEKNWTFPTLSIHGKKNGLSSVATLQRMSSVLQDAGCNIHIRTFPKFGHQDTWLGRDAVEVFGAVGAFLSGPAPAPVARVDVEQELYAKMPAAGPVWAGQATARAAKGDRFSIMCDPTLPGALHVVCVPISRDKAHYVCAAGMAPVTRKWTAGPNDDGWMTLTREPAMIGPLGTLVLIVYNEASVVAQDDWTGTPFAGARAGKTGVPAAPPPLAATLLAPVAGMTEPVRLAVRKALANKDGDWFKPGVLGVPLAARAAGSAITFAVGSCQYPPGLLDSFPAYRSYARIANMLKQRHRLAPAFLVLAGDQIYSDASAGLFDPTALDDRYKRPYERLFANKHVRAVLRQRPAFMMLDDHEIADNWEAEMDQDSRDAFTAGRDGYLRYQRGEARREVGADSALWYTFSVDGLDFFMADTRTERENRSVKNIGTAKIMLDEQMAALLAWLERPHTGPKFVVTSAALGLRRREITGAHDVARLRCDGWEGYPASMQRLLAHICAKQIRNVVFLSGDEHISCDIRLRLTHGDKPPVEVRSIHASPLYAPYPFANARMDDFVAGPDQYGFGDGADRIECHATTHFTEGDGFALITVESDDSLGVLFDRERPPAKARSLPEPGPGAPQQTPLPCDSVPREYETQQIGELSPSLQKAASRGQ
jgi:cholesterol oxidase